MKKLNEIWQYDEKKKKQNNPQFYEFIMKVDVQRFGYNNLLQDFKFMYSVAEIAMDVWWNNRRKESVCV